MKICEANITKGVFDFLSESLKKKTTYNSLNETIQQAFGIVGFCINKEDFTLLKKELNAKKEVNIEEDRTAYGDFQTPTTLAERTCEVLKNKKLKPVVCIEPTCGKGNFIIASLSTFSTIKFIYGIEIYKPYVWETKFNILHYYLTQPPNINKPTIKIIHENIFTFDFKQIIKNHKEEYLLIGNPPWVTNAQLGELESENLPVKRNFKKLSGLDALTGKSNFDIAEFILLKLFTDFEKTKGTIAFLIKNSVVKNIIESCKNKVSNFQQYTFDAKKEFDVATDASAFVASFNQKLLLECKVYSLYEPKREVKRFGWVKDSFVSDIEAYNDTRNYEGEFPYVWRSGIKHDCSKVFELKKENGHYINKLKEEINLEKDLIYPLLKSSQLKERVITNSDNYVIVTQKKIGDETKFIEQKHPKTYQYLKSKNHLIEKRKSSIYRGKPPFSIFGVGDYTFEPYKIAISGLYKKANFSLLLPVDGKTIVLDDTCYMIGFSDLKKAIIVAYLLNSEEVFTFLKAITFQDAKRVYSKSTLMRINLAEVLKNIDKVDLLKKCNETLKSIKEKTRISEKYLFAFQEKMMNKNKKQMSLFK